MKGNVSRQSKRATAAKEERGNRAYQLGGETRVAGCGGGTKETGISFRRAIARVWREVSSVPGTEWLGEIGASPSGGSGVRVSGLRGGTYGTGRSLS